MPEPAAPPTPPEAEIIAGMLAGLDAAGSKGLSEAKLLGTVKSRKPEHVAALQRLERGGLAVMRRKGRGALWFAARHAPTAETVTDVLREQAVPCGAVAWTTAELGRLLAPAQRELLAEALSVMAKAGEAWELRAVKGSARFWVFSKALILGGQPLPQVSTQDAGAAAQAAYAAWRRKSGSSLMAIGDLQAASGMPLATLHNWLCSEAAAGRAELSEGDWSLAPAEVRAAALSLQGQKFIRVRLQERG